MLAYLRDTTAKKSHQRDLYSATNLTEHFGGKLLSDIGPEQIAEYKRARRAPAATNPAAKPAKDATIAKELLLLSAAVRHARSEWGWTIENPVSGRVPRMSKGQPKWLRPDEVEKLKAAVRRSQHLADFIELGLVTGMRCEEMLSLEWSRVDFGGRLILFDADDQKSGVPGSIPLNNRAIAVLRKREAYRRQYCNTSPWVFCTKSGERLQWIKRTFARAAARAGVKASPHSLRHTFASRLVQAGVPLRDVADLCRHADIRTTMRYAHLAPENTRRAIEVLDRDQIVTESGQDLAKAGQLSHAPAKTAA